MIPEQITTGLEQIKVIMAQDPDKAFRLLRSMESILADISDEAAMAPRQDFLGLAAEIQTALVEKLFITTALGAAGWQYDRTESGSALRVAVVASVKAIQDSLVAEKNYDAALDVAKWQYNHINSGSAERVAVVASVKAIQDGFVAEKKYKAAFDAAEWQYDRTESGSEERAAVVASVKAIQDGFVAEKNYDAALDAAGWQYNRTKSGSDEETAVFISLVDIGMNCDPKWFEAKLAPLNIMPKLLTPQQRLDVFMSNLSGQAAAVPGAALTLS